MTIEFSILADCLDEILCYMLHDVFMRYLSALTSRDFQKISQVGTDLLKIANLDVVQQYDRAMSTILRGKIPVMTYEQSLKIEFRHVDDNEFLDSMADRVCTIIKAIEDCLCNILCYNPDQISIHDILGGYSSVICLAHTVSRFYPWDMKKHQLTPQSWDIKN